jgi:asparagine synthase (glutamine-hydrolysing)
VTALAGFWSFGGQHDPARQCARMLQAQRIYAPDPPAVKADGSVALGRRLFKLLPEDRYDHGPAAGAGDSLLVADLRLDNREELCSHMGIGTGEAQRLSDAAIVMKALERWEEDAPRRLLGDFAFAWWSGARQKLVLARDFAGQRPLHYHRGEGFFAFASMPKGLLALPQISTAPNRRTIAQALALMPETGSETFFEAVEKVVSGETVTVTRDGLSSRRHWAPERSELRLKRREDYQEALREQMDRAVRVRLRGADGRVASHLSGGLDSSAVTATAARLLGSSGSVTAFTSVPREGFEAPASRDSIADEGPLAASVAALFANIDHVKVPSAQVSPLADLEGKFFLYDRPLTNPCNHVWHSAIMTEAKRRGLTVLLNGNMGNFSISYDGMALLSQLLRSGRLFRLAAETFHLLRGGTRLGTVAAQTIAPFLPPQIWHRIQRMRGSEIALSDYSTISESAAAGLREVAAERALDVSYRPRADGFEARIWMFRRVDLGNFNKGDLGRWGIDQRDPTADRNLVEFCLSVPPEHYLAKGWTRALTRDAFADRLPQSVLRERRKGYQAADWHEGLTAARADIRSDIDRLADCDVAAEAIDLGRIGRLTDDWPEGGWQAPNRVRQYRLALLRGVGVGRFARWSVGSNG